MVRFARVSGAPRVSPLWILAFGVAGCGKAPPSNLPTGENLHYRVSYMGSETTFVIQADGTARYQAKRGPDSVDVTAKVQPEELADLAAILKKNGFCSLTPSRDKGRLDEARPHIAVRLGDLDCLVVMLDGDFYDDKKANACLRAVESLGQKVRTRGLK